MPVPARAFCVSGQDVLTLRSTEVRIAHITRFFQQRTAEHAPVHRRDDVEALRAQLERMVEFAAPLHKTFYGTDEFAVVDNNGYVLIFAKNRE